MGINRVFLCLSLALGVSVSLPARAQQHGDHEHGAPVEFKMPTTYKAAVREVFFRLHEIEALMAAKKLDQVHAQADVIRKVGDVAGQLALKSDSGVPRESIKEVNRAGRELAAKFDAIDKAADSGDSVGTRRVFDEMKKHADVLRRHSPKEYGCPMRCEGEKTSPKPGKCSQCGMKLQDVLSHMDHNPKHGGVFFMAPDQKHHLEGTISGKGEFRVYFYDEYTKPISAEKFTGEGTAWTQGKDAETPLKLRPAPEKAFLTAAVDASVKFPIRIKIFIDFKDGERPQVFDFEFAETSKPPTGHEAEVRNDREEGKYANEDAKRGH
ncbi:MAG: hypothetical protein L6R00_17350 [Phycisphaerae bacterium]|nr:hypothetical protein [Phycisphaerae bacterium]